MYSPLRANSRVLTAALAGTTIEFYDFYVYGTAAALVLGPLFFPKGSPDAQSLYALMSFGVAFFARPLGAILFGHFGDRVGRKSTLVVSLMLMGGATLAIAFLPTYAAIGWSAPALLCLLRFSQGLGLGGEWGGASLLAVENAPPGWAGRFGTVPQLGSPIGFLCANGLFLLLGLGLSDADFRSWGWRIPFLLSAVLVALGLWVRLRISETPEFKAALERNPPASVPLTRLLASHSGALLAATAGAVAVFAIFYLATAFALAQGTGPLGHTRETFLAVQLAASLVQAVGLLVAGWASDRYGVRATLIFGAVAAMVIGLLFGPGLMAPSLGVVFIALAGALFIMGFVYAPLAAWMASLFPVALRYSGMSVAFSLGGIIGGAIMPIYAKLLADGGQGAYVGLLISAAGLMTLLGVTLSRAHIETG